MDRVAAATHQSFLFLQVDTSLFAVRLAALLAASGARIDKLHICAGDLLFWPRRGARWFRGAAADWPAFVGAAMDRGRTTDLILTGEQRPYHRAAIAEARQRGITVTVHDFGYLRPDWIAFEQDGMATWSRLPRSATGLRRLAAAAPPLDTTPRFAESFAARAAGDIGFHAATALFGALFPQYRSFQPYGVLRFCLGHLRRLLAAGRSTAAARRAIAAAVQAPGGYFVLPMQMEADFSLRAYSPFPDMMTPIGLAIRSFAQHADPAAQLLVKLHPHDPGLRPWRRLIAAAAAAAGVAQRVAFIDGGSLDALLANTRGVVTVNSTVGIWALRQGAPLIALGDAIFDVPGLTHQHGLDSFWTAAVAPDPALTDSFLRAIADTLHIRGLFHGRAGQQAAVRAAAARLAPAAAAALAARLCAAGDQRARFAPVPAERRA